MLLFIYFIYYHSFNILGDFFKTKIHFDISINELDILFIVQYKIKILKRITNFKRYSHKLRCINLLRIIIL